MKKEYSNGEVTIIWKPDLCIHSGICARGLSSVFKPKERPWITPEGATTEQLTEQVKKCPSGALSFRMDKSDPTDAEMEKDSIEVQVMSNGPYIVKGKIILTHADGKQETKESSTAFCRCGASENKPFCDGTHRKTGFTG